MIPINTELQPRQKGDPVVTVVGIEAERYILAPVEFGSPFDMDFDEITAAYDCSAHKVNIEPYDEAAAYEQLSRERFTQTITEANRRARQREAAAESPNQVFERQAREAE